MEIYLNINHAQSMQGFRLTRMDASQLTDIVSPEELPAPIFSFLSDDLFRAIWCDIAAPGAFAQKDTPVYPVSSYFGIKGLKGVYRGGMYGFIDAAFFVGANELPALARLVNSALCCGAAFSSLLFGCIGINAEGNYVCSREALFAELPNLPTGALPSFVLNPELTYRKPRDLLHFAACLGSRERAMEVLEVRPTFFHRQTGLLDADEFDARIR